MTLCVQRLFSAIRFCSISRPDPDSIVTPAYVLISEIVKRCSFIFMILDRSDTVLCVKRCRTVEGYTMSRIYFFGDQESEESGGGRIEVHKREVRLRRLQRKTMLS